MAKGATNQPLVIWVAEQWYAHPEILKLMAAGHTIAVLRVSGGDLCVGPSPWTGPPDLILHPAAHAWGDDMWDYLPAALTAARARRRKKS